MNEADVTRLVRAIEELPIGNEDVVSMLDATNDRLSEIEAALATLDGIRDNLGEIAGSLDWIARQMAQSAEQEAAQPNPMDMLASMIRVPSILEVEEDGETPPPDAG